MLNSSSQVLYSYPLEQLSEHVKSKVREIPQPAWCRAYTGTWRETF